MVSIEQCEFISDTEVVVRGICPVTRKSWEVTCPVNGWHEWFHGRQLIQRAMPGLSAEQRELLISGTSPEGWEILFGGCDA